MSACGGGRTGGGETLKLEGSKFGAGLPIAILAVVAGAYLWEIVSLSGIPVARDMQMFFVPQKQLLAEALRAGEVPLWTPYIGVGAPFLANVQSGVFYPPNWLYAILPFFVAFNLLLASHFALGGIFAFLLCRRLGAGAAAAYLGAVTWMLGGYFASLLNLVNALQSAAWAPGLAWAALRVLEDRRPRATAILVLMGTAAALAGEPQSFLLAGFASVVTAHLWWRPQRPGGERPGPALGRIAIAGGFIVGLAMIQILPTLELLAASGRGEGLSYGEAVAFDLQPVRLLYLLIPPDYRDPEYAFGVRSIIGRGDPWLFSIYVGAALPLFLYFAWRAPRRRLETAVWSAIGVGGILVALGESTPVFGWLFDHVPGFGAFRFPEKYFFLTAFAAMLLAARGGQAFLEGARHRHDRLFAGAYVGIPVLALAGLHLGRDAVREWARQFGNDRMFEDFGWAFGVWSQNLGKLALLAALLVALAWWHRRGSLSPRWMAFLVCAVVTGDLSVAHRSLNPVVEESFYESEPLVLRHVPLERIQRDYRYRASRFDSVAGQLPVLRGIPLEMQKWVWQQTMGPNVGQRWRVLQQDAWDAIKLRGQADERDLHRAIPDAGRRWALLRLHSVRYVHSLIPLSPGAQAIALPLDTLPGYLYELRDPLPRAYVVPAARHVGDPVAAINLLLDAAFDPRAAVVLIDSMRSHAGDASPAPAGGDAAPGPSTRPPPGATILEAEAHRVRISLDHPSRGYLVLTDAHYPGWAARVDGEAREIRPANFFFRAVEIAPGDREVTFEYRSRPFDIGWRVSLLTLVLAVTLFGWSQVRARDTG